MEGLGLKQLADNLIPEKSKKKRKSLEEDFADGDKEYTPGNDSLATSDEEEAPKV